MAKRKTGSKLTARPAESVAPVSVAPAAALELTEFPDAMSFINSLSQSREGIEWDIRVYNATGTGGRGNTTRPQYLFTVELEELPDLERRLSELFAPTGGGDFRVDVRADNQRVKNIWLSIAPIPGYKKPPPSYMVTAQPAETAPAANHMETFFLRLAEMQERGAQQTRDLIQALASRPETKQPTMLEQIQMFTELQKLMPQGAQQNGMAMFEKGMELATKMFEARGDGGDGATWMDIVRDALNSPVIKDMIAGAAAAGQQHQLAAPANMGPPALLDPANPQAVLMMDTLLKQAQQNLEPKAIAAQIEEMAPPTLMMELEQQADIPGYVISKFPAFAPHRVWLAQVVANIWEEGDTARPSPTLAPAPNAQAAAH